MSRLLLCMGYAKSSPHIPCSKKDDLAKAIYCIEVIAYFFGIVAPAKCAQLKFALSILVSLKFALVKLA